jgi:hypothetical protein
VRCSSVGVTVADGGPGNSDEVFPLQLRRCVGGELLWQPFVAAIVRTLRGTRRYPQTENLRLEANAGHCDLVRGIGREKLAAGACRKR